MTGAKEFEFKSFDDFAEIFQDEENKKNGIKSIEKAESKVVTKQQINYSPVTVAKRYHRKTTGPIVISLEEYKARVKNGNLPEPKKERITTPNSQNNSSKKENKSNESYKNNASTKKKIKKPKNTSIKKSTTTKEFDEEKKKQKRIAKISKQIERNLARQNRWTEPKKRNLLSRIILQNRLAKGYYDYVEDNYNFFTAQEIEESKNAKKRRDRSLYKEVQQYEDAEDDVTVRRGWTAFKIGLAAAMLAGSLALANYTANEVKNTFNNISASNQIVSVYDMGEEEKGYIYSKAYGVKKQILENDGYHFDNLSEDEFADGYYRILNYEKKMYENMFKSASFRITENRDQTLLYEIVEKAFKEDYQNLTEEQKRDYKQLAFELLPYSLPKIFEDGNHYLRNPIVFDELKARDVAKEKGYKITLRVNGDEKETVRNLGNVMHILNEMQEDDYKYVSQIENGQQKFFEEILVEVMGDKYNELEKNEKRDYSQIIYEWLPDSAKQYIKDPIEVEKAAEDIEIGD